MTTEDSNKEALACALYDILARKFSSGNNVEIERCTIRREEWEELHKQFQYQDQSTTKR